MYVTIFNLVVNYMNDSIVLCNGVYIAAEDGNFMFLILLYFKTNNITDGNIITI